MVKTYFKKPKVEKVKTCKICGEVIKTVTTFRKCIKCRRQQAREKKEESNARKLDRKLNSKKYKKEVTKATTNLCTKLWREAVMKLYGDTCMICGSNKVNIHHVVGRRNKNVKWYVPNGAVVCSKHHVFDQDSAHQNPLWFRNKLLEQRGSAWEANLLKKANQVWDKDIEAIKEKLINLNN